MYAELTFTPEVRDHYLSRDKTTIPDDLLQLSQRLQEW